MKHTTVHKKLPTVNVTTDSSTYLRCQRCGKPPQPQQRGVRPVGWFHLSDEWRRETWRLCEGCRISWEKWLRGRG